MTTGFAIDAFVEIRELPRHARIDLDDGDAATGGLIEQFDVEQPVREADRLDGAACDVFEPRHDVGVEPRRIFEAHEGAGAGIHHRIDGAQDVDASGAGIAVDADPQASSTQPSAMKQSASMSQSRCLRGDAAKRPGEPLMMIFPQPEAQVLAQRGLVGAAFGEHREGRLTGLTKIG